MIVYFTFCLLLTCAASVQIQSSSAGFAYTTSEDGSHLSKEKLAWSKPDVQSDVQLVFDSSAKLQAIEGFGGAFTEASALNFKRLSGKDQARFIDMYFGEDGHRYNIGRVPINSCDFSTGSYSFDDNGGVDDLDLKHFDKTVAADQENGMIPLIKTALKAVSSTGQELRLFGSPWSPPSWMKQDNHPMVGSTTPCLKQDPRIHKAWADYLAEWVKAYDKHGIKMWGLTAQNEPGAPDTTPWEACTFSATDQRDFIRDLLGPRMHAAAVNLIAFDDQKDNLREWADVILGDPDTAQYVWGFGLHWYSGLMVDQVAYVSATYPERRQLSTEGCSCLKDLVQYNTSWARGARYVHDMIGDLNNGVVGWVDWNLLVDTSGPQGTGGPNHANNTCFAHIHVDAEGSMVVHDSYWLFGHFSRFLPRGSRAVAHSLRKAPQAGLEASVFVRPDGATAVAILSNAMQAQARTVSIRDEWWPAAAVVLEVPPRSVVTVEVSLQPPCIA